MAKRKAASLGFGACPVKLEGGIFRYDPIAKRPKGKRGVGVDYMEIPVQKNASRARVHKMVDEWLDDRARGFRRCM